MPRLSLTSNPALPPLLPAHPFRAVKTLVAAATSDVNRRHPIASLRRGDWVKLICGASFEDAADVRNLSLVYTLAGVDCIDCAADESVVSAVRDGIAAAAEIVDVRRPWVMVSVNDDREDVHFRKAEFDPEDCPSDCSRPCEMVCPANAISLTRVSVGEEITGGSSTLLKLQGGVLTERCYGCGRCFPVCPYDKISSLQWAGLSFWKGLQGLFHSEYAMFKFAEAMTYIRDPAATSALLKRDYVDAVEIHTSGRRTDLFSNLWNSLGDSVGHVKLVAVSLPDMGESIVSVMNAVYSIMEPHLQCYNLWQLDGRPMSGDIGQGATRKTITFANHLTSIPDRPHGFYQLAGGTNSHTIDYLKKVGLFRAMTTPAHHHNQSTTVKPGSSHEALIGGIAYGGYARKVVGRVLRKVASQHGEARIEDYPEYLLEAVSEALSLVGPVKGYNLC